MIKGDKSKRVGGVKQSKGPAATKKSVAPVPRGKRVEQPGGLGTYKPRGKIYGPSYGSK
jgi:hypothetical protein